MAESGLPGFKYDTWFALLAPSATPKAEVEKFHTAMAKVMADPVVQYRLTRLGMEPGTMSIDELNQFLKADYAAAGALVKLSGARVE